MFGQLALFDNVEFCSALLLYFETCDKTVLNDCSNIFFENLFFKRFNINSEKRISDH